MALSVLPHDHGARLARCPHRSCCPWLDLLDLVARMGDRATPFCSGARRALTCSYPLWDHGVHRPAPPPAGPYLPLAFCMLEYGMAVHSGPYVGQLELSLMDLQADAPRAAHDEAGPGRSPLSVGYVELKLDTIAAGYGRTSLAGGHSEWHTVYRGIGCKVNALLEFLSE